MGRRFVDMRTIARRMQHKDDRINRALAKQKEHDAMTDLVTAPPKELPSPEVISKVLLGGDLSQLSPQQRISYYRAVCESLGLNPLTKPFEFLRLSGKEVLYALRNATDQLRNLYGISVTITSREVVEDTYVVTARATLPNGRHDESIGAVPIANLKGEARANACMKAETKSKRRVTLSLVGLSTLDESEVESIPQAAPLSFNPENGTIDPPASARMRRVPEGAGSVGAPATPADPVPPGDENLRVPEAWRPFVQEPETIRGQIVSGKRNKTKTTAVMDTGEEVTTLDPDLGAEVIAAKASGARVEITTRTTGVGKEIVSITHLDAAHDAAF